MMKHLNFPAVGMERMRILDAARKPVVWESLNEGEKIAFVQGMDRGYYQGLRDQAKKTIEAFTQTVVGFKP